MSISKICNDVSVILGTEKGIKKVKQRRGVMAELRKALDKAPKNKRLVSCGVWFSTTQSDTKRAKGHVRVQMLGLDVGHLELDRAAVKPKFKFHPTMTMKEHHSDLPNPPWEWSNNLNDGNAIWTYLNRCKDDPRAKSDSEREIQWELAYALKSNKKPESLRHLQPVTWNGLFTEIGVAVTKDGKVSARGTGNIDLLVRRVRGYLIFEIKKPRESNVKQALDQAIRYATALDIEANGNKGNPIDEQNRENYHSVFHSNAKRELKIGVVVVMENNKKVLKTAPGILKTYWCDKGASKIDRLGMLLYKYEENKETSWSWLNSDWDARSVLK